MGNMGGYSMKVTSWVSAIALAGAATLAGSPVWAAAGDNCVKILGYEWSGEKQSMDPADMHSGDDAYHTFAVYNRLSMSTIISRSCRSWRPTGRCRMTG